MRSLRQALCWLLLAGAGAGAASAPDLLPSDASSGRSLMASPTEGAAPPIDTSALDFSAFLVRHDLTWAWRWDASSAYTLQPRAAALSHCGGDDGACCLAAGRDGGVSLAACDATKAEQQWTLSGSGQYRCGGKCLTDAGPGQLMATCENSSSSSSSTGSAKQSWRHLDGYIFNVQTNNCLQIQSNESFCTGTVCPLDRASPFVAGSSISTSQSNNGDRSQLFAAYTLPSGTAPAAQNRVPTTWTTSAYAGNGLLGVRVASEAGDSGVLRLYMDRADIGEYSHREPTGYFRLQMPNPNALPLRVSMRQSLHDAAVRANISDASGSVSATAAPLLSFQLFVDASNLENNGTATYLTVEFQPGFEPELEWVPCVSSGNSVGCGDAAATNATQSVTKDGVALSVHATKLSFHHAESQC